MLRGETIELKAESKTVGGSKPSSEQKSFCRFSKKKRDSILI